MRQGLSATYAGGEYSLLDIHQQRLLNTSPNGILVTDPNLPDNPIVFASDKFVEMTGYNRDEILGQNCRFLNTKDRDQPILETLKQAIQDQEPFEGILRNFRKDGTPFWNELCMKPIFDDNGALCNFIGVVRDVTEKVELQAALQAAKEEAETANNRKNKVLAYISHDYRTLIGVILGYASMIKEPDVTPEERQAWIEAIQNCAELMKEMSTSLLDISLIDANQMALTPEPVNLSLLMTEVNGMTQLLAKEKDVSLNIDIDKGLEKIITDPGKIKQVLLNLITNAIKYNRPGGDVRVRLSKTADNQWLEGLIEDTGLGISPEELPHLFTEFYQSASGKKTGQGYGLGLALTRRLIKYLGGDIQVTSIEGEGSRFIFQLPLQSPLSLSPEGI